jgi:hypothetical protein
MLAFHVNNNSWSYSIEILYLNLQETQYWAVNQLTLLVLSLFFLSM